MVTPKVTKQSGYCVVEKSTNETIGLVRVCHQIKAETAYMPCVADTVHFATIDDFDQNAAALSALQRAAVTKLSVNFELVFANRIPGYKLRITDWFPNVETVDVCRTGMTEPTHHHCRKDDDTSLILQCSCCVQYERAILFLETTKRDGFWTSFRFSLPYAGGTQCVGYGCVEAM
jgi:hypothetical protein